MAMSKFVDYYRMLQVHHDAGQDIINAAYRHFSKLYHPDVNKSVLAIEKMKQINMAYDVIGDPRKRKAYHREWLRMNAQIKPDFRAMRFTEKPRVSETELAEKVLAEFFDDLVNEKWQKSFQKFTFIDHRNIPLEDYIEWKKVVAKLYKLGNYKIQYSRTYENCEYAGVVYPKILHFSVTLTEMETTTGKVSQERTQKYVALDHGQWRVCLGYKDLKRVIQKFKYLAETLGKIDREEIIERALASIDPLTGILSRRGFIEQAEKELVRSQRYGNPLSLGIVTLRPGKSPGKGNEEEFAKKKDSLVSYISETLNGSIRQTDVIGRCGDTSIALLFPETKTEKAKLTMVRLLKSIEGNEPLNCDIYWSSASLKGRDINVHRVIDELMEKGVLWENPANADPGTKKLGKYSLSDILEFNKKGRNHF